MENTNGGTLENNQDVTIPDDFSDAFESAAGEELRPDLSNADNPDNVPEGDGVTVNKEDLTVNKPDDAPPPPDNTPPPDNKAPNKDDDATYEQRWKTLQGIHKHDKETWEEEKARLLAEVEEAKLKAAPPEPPTTKDTTKDDELFLKSFLDSLTDEQKENLQKYDEEFDVISAMEGLKRDSAMKKLRADLLSEVTKIKEEFQSQLKPANDLIQETQANKEKLTEEAHFNAIRTNHPDFETYRDDGSILKWIEAKPVYLRKGLVDVYSQGTAEEIVALLSDFKKENNITPPDAPPPPDKVTNIDQKRQDRKSALLAPDTRQASINQGLASANNYDDAFDEAINK
jgi:hypothetical protein